jgi:hypothetical protein
MLKASELRIAKAHCEAAFRSVEAARAAYLRARVPESPARKASRARESEQKEFSRRDAVDMVMTHHGVPLDVACAAVRIVERRGVGRGPKGSRWERLAEAVTGAELTEAWGRLEKKKPGERPGPEGLARRFATKKAAKKATKRRKKTTPRPPDVVILEDWDDAPF